MKELDPPPLKTQPFIKRLKKELPLWVAQGWVKPEHEKDIINSVIEKEPFEAKTSIIIFSLLGMILFSVGILLFIAAHWESLPKLVKLLLMFGGLWGAYGAADYFFLHQKHNPYFKSLGHLFLLLGVFLFGANIALIAQIYHISAHFPNGILIWSLGAWCVALCLHNKPSIFASLLLAGIWSYTESEFYLDKIHWPFLIIMALNLWVILKEKWVVAEKWESPFDFFLFILGIWLLMNFIWISKQYYTLYFNSLILITFIVLMVSISFYLKRAKESLILTRLKMSLQHHAVFYFLFVVFLLTFPDGVKYIGLASMASLALTCALLFLAFLAYVYFMRENDNISRIIKISGAAVFSALGALLILNHVLDHPSLMAIFFNIVFLSILLWLIGFGHEMKDKLYINLAFLYFAALVIARYFDVFWGLLNRSLFFVMGGLLLLVGSYLIEKKRRKFTESLKAPQIKTPPSKKSSSVNTQDKSL